VRTDCSEEQLEFKGHFRKRVVGRFDAGRVSSDGGLVLLREVAERTGVLRRFAGCFDDLRRPELIEHTVEELVAQRVLGIACGYEDLIDHDTLRDDALLAIAVGKRDATGADRSRATDRGHALAGKSTLNRLELTPAAATAKDRYKKIVYRPDEIDAFFVDEFLDAFSKPPTSIVLDLDATDDPVHGNQEGRFFHGYYGHYCYLPLYIFCGDHLLLARLRRADIDGAAGALEEVQRIVARIRARWPKVRITLRADSGFARDAIMTWCEENAVDYVFGLARNGRLEALLADDMAEVKKEQAATGVAARRFRELRYLTLDSWSRERRVVGKAEQLPGKENPRFVVTSLTSDEWQARALYEDLYCARGDMENRIKEQQLDMFADRTSTATMRANQLRLWFSSLAYVLVMQLRRLGLRGTELERAQAGTIRSRLLKVAAVIAISVRRVVLSFSSVFPLQRVFATALHNIQASPRPG
jgi:hypothetical protein